MKVWPQTEDLLLDERESNRGRVAGNRMQEAGFWLENSKIMSKEGKGGPYWAEQ